MKSDRWSNHSNPLLWRLRVAAAATFLIAAAAMAFVALKSSSPPLLGKSERPHHAMSPAAVRLASPETSAGVQSGAGPQYGLFTCQVGLNIPGRQCYDPYQMRHAYQVDSLINAGFDGTGHTIVIVDAFQNPNLVSQVATYNTFYGLPPTNLTQIAPDGLTPFVPGDLNMTGWAEEISLDVEWAHNIAPGANIVLVLAKTNQDADILSALKYAVDNNLGDVISMSFGEDESCVDSGSPDRISQRFCGGDAEEHHPVRLLRRSRCSSAELRRQLLVESSLSPGRRSAGHRRRWHRAACRRLLPSGPRLRSERESVARDVPRVKLHGTKVPLVTSQTSLVRPRRLAADSAFYLGSHHIRKARTGFTVESTRACPTLPTMRPFSTAS